MFCYHHLLSKSVGSACSEKTQLLYITADISMENLLGKTVFSNSPPAFDTPPALMSVCRAKALICIVKCGFKSLYMG